MEGSYKIIYRHSSGDQQYNQSSWRQVDGGSLPTAIVLNRWVYRLDDYPERGEYMVTAHSKLDNNYKMMT
eukprot:scaffold35059_cov283-Skeletonema_dohrnii-CCMP3373.AAC.1